MECKIVVVGVKDDYCLIELKRLPNNAKVVAYGCTLNELEGSGSSFTEVHSYLCHQFTLELTLIVLI